MDRFGINMKKWCRAHEQKMKNAPSLREHQEKIAILQHERLVHLIVTVMVVIAELFVVDIVLLHSDRFGILPAVIMLLLAVLLVFYFAHYFFLENTVQRWYRILEDLENRK